MYIQLFSARRAPTPLERWNRSAARRPHHSMLSEKGVANRVMGLSLDQSNNPPPWLHSRIENLVG